MRFTYADPPAVNLLEETVEVLQEEGKTVADVRWVGTAGGSQSCSWEQFAPMANHVYDAGYGGAQIRVDLVVVGADWWLERREYDGSEWWAFVTQPRKYGNGPLETVWDEDRRRFRLAGEPTS